MMDHCTALGRAVCMLNMVEQGTFQTKGMDGGERKWHML